MPCYDPSDKEDRYEKPYRETSIALKTSENKVNLLESFLCGIFTSVESLDEFNIQLKDYILKHVDYKEGGFTRKQLEDWWENHQEEDRIRHEEEDRKRNIMMAELKSRKNQLEAEIRQIEEKLGIKTHEYDDPNGVGNYRG